MNPEGISVEMDGQRVGVAGGIDEAGEGG